MNKHWYSQSGKERENSSVFRRRRKTVSDSEDCTDNVKVFHAYIGKMTYKPSELGHTDLVFGLWAELTVSMCSSYDLWPRG